MGIHCDVATFVLRVHDIVEETTDLVLVPKCARNRVHFGLGVSRQYGYGLLNRVVAAPCELVFVALVSEFRSTELPVRGDDWERRVMVGLGIHPYEPRLPFNREFLEGLALHVF